ncbi:MAG: hypothetical protein IJD04_03750, partial [Desulfovibrionaceae bacterium]|nr:hypothetical protein [Desulfovibrionaceae bacterium]
MKAKFYKRETKNRERPVDRRGDFQFNFMIILRIIPKFPVEIPVFLQKQEVICFSPSSRATEYLNSSQVSPVCRADSVGKPQNAPPLPWQSVLSG